MISPRSTQHEDDLQAECFSRSWYKPVPASHVKAWDELPTEGNEWLLPAGSLSTSESYFKGQFVEVIHAYRKIMLSELTLDTEVWGDKPEEQKALYGILVSGIGERVLNKGAESIFQSLADKWRKETAHISSIAKMVMHPSYQSIIGMGPDIVPLLLRELKQQDPDHWFWALAAITRENPIEPQDAGDTAKMAEAWVRWGEERGYL
jgi:hypothetical protein